MKLADNPFTHGLARGEKQVGLWVTLCSNFVAEVTAPAGYDWVLIDMEHSPNDYQSVLGYRPKDNAEQFAEAILAGTEPMDNQNPGNMCHGGPFAAVELGNSGVATMNIIDDTKKT